MTISKREQALQKAQALKVALLRRNLPVQKVFLFGSAATGAMHKWSDIDIAIVCNPFKNSRHEEAVECSTVGLDIDPRIEVVCLHPEDMDSKYSSIVQEVKKCGLEA